MFRLNGNDPNGHIVFYCFFKYNVIGSLRPVFFNEVNGKLLGVLMVEPYQYGAIMLLAYFLLQFYGISLES